MSQPKDRPDWLLAAAILVSRSSMVPPRISVLAGAGMEGQQ
jgi:hypothetical protein